MKTILLLTVLMFTLTVYSQEYIPFPTENARWGMGVECQDSQHRNLYVCTSFGDTIINGIKYNRLKQKIRNFNIVTSTVRYDSLTSLFFREEEKKIYFYTKRYGEELYYDFNLSLGDTMAWEYGDSAAVINEFEVCGRKAIELQNLTADYLGLHWTVTWVQGIGSLDGLLSPFGSPGCWAELMCYKDGRFEEQCYDCSFVNELMSIDKEIKVEKLSIYPNPCKDIIKVESTGKQIFRVKVFDTSAKKLLDKTYLRQSVVELNVSSLKKGVYFLKVTTNKGVFNQTFVTE